VQGERVIWLAARSLREDESVDVRPARSPATTSPTTTVVVMGVSGSGKTTVAAELVARLGWVFAEGDDFHPPANIAAMHAGHPLGDEQRWPWLAAIADWIGLREQAGQSAVLTCSALRRAYRDRLRDGHESVWFAHVTADPALIADRLQRRTGHYMPPSLLPSQLQTLQPLEPDEPGTTVSGAAAPQLVAAAVLDALSGRGRDGPTSTGATP